MKNLATGVFLCGVLLGSLSAEVLTVGGQTGTYSEIADAVLVAQDGDVILVAAGNYDGFMIVDKSLTVMAAYPWADVYVLGTIGVRDLSLGKTVVLDGFGAFSGGWKFWSGACSGSVRIANSNFRGGVLVGDCTDVTATGCNMGPSPSGGRGVLLFNAEMAMYGCTSEGGEDHTYPGDHGVYLFSGSDMFFSGGSASGGDGSPPWQGLGWHPGEAGGDGVRSLGANVFRYMDSSFTGGSSGEPGWAPAGLPVNVGTLIPGTARFMEASRLVFDTAQVELVFRGDSGDVVSYAVSDSGGFVNTSDVGPLLVHNPQWIQVGVIPTGGVLHVTHPIPDQAALGHSTLHFQGRFSAAGVNYLSNPTLTVVLDRGLDTCDVLETPLGRDFCTPSVVNSSGTPGRLSAYGSHCVSNNLVRLMAADLPQSQFGYVVNSRGVGFIGNPGGSDGNLCVGGGQPVGRHNAIADIRNSGPEGVFFLDIDLTQMPSPTGLVTVTAGQVWGFQAWYRDGSGSNFTNGIQMLFH